MGTFPGGAIKAEVGGSGLEGRAGRASRAAGLRARRRENMATGSLTCLEPGGELTGGMVMKGMEEGFHLY